MPNSNHKTVFKIVISKAHIKVRPNFEQIFREKKNVGWQAFYDYPHPEEMGGFDFDYEKMLIYLETLRSYGPGNTSSKDKRYGWPFWVQAMEYPKGISGKKQK